MTQQANARSIWDEMIQPQNVVKELEGWAAKLEIEKQHIAKELRRIKEEHDAALERHEKEVAELKRKDAFFKESAIEGFSSNNYMEIVEKAASTYFNKGFNLCKKQIGLLRPNLNIQDL
ncbi:hypothetical protein Acr_19g0011270 [Actinidia rufa]|uniref:Uncharacterized protein n=1 Tax=Actinidia rufa TaxID=165716 RepID=A0A7J0GBM9_9ERIC|nr:hypothetical protein Acr_19g0011270 [Actinidia rufa]